MSTQQMDTATNLVTKTSPKDSHNGHTKEGHSSNGSKIENKIPPVYWQIAPTSTNGHSPHDTTPRGYVSLPDYEDELIPLHELPNKPWWPGDLPDHTQLPDSDDEMKNYIEHPQSILITTSIRPVLERVYGQRYKIGQDTGIYWRWQLGTDPLEGKRAPDWFYIPDTDPFLTRSHVLWRERVPPYLLIEFVSGTGREERDNTQRTGKFWVYETVIQPQYYAIYEEHEANIELYELVNGQFQQIAANNRGHYPIPSLDIELGLWHGTYSNHTTDWLRIWDSDGTLLLSGEERAEVERRERELADQRAEAERRERELADQRAEAERRERELAEQRATTAEDEVARLQALLKQHGISL
ncbi:MAG: Uma2 family endonuclease [Chloroflexota bacterium]